MPIPLPQASLQVEAAVDPQKSSLSTSLFSFTKEKTSLFSRKFKRKKIIYPYAFLCSGIEI